MTAASVLIFCPAYKYAISSTTVTALSALYKGLSARGIQWGFSTISSPDIEWVRNFALTWWYDQGPSYTHLLFVDDDMGFMPELVLDMLLFGEPVVGAIYPKKTYPIEWAASGLENPEVRGSFMEVEGLGCGCFLIRRDAITKMIAEMPELIDGRDNAVLGIAKNAGLHRLIKAFDCLMDPAKGKVSEDISFCRRWRSLGGKVWTPTNHKLSHIGPHEYAGTFSTWTHEEVKKVASSADDGKFDDRRPDGTRIETKHGVFFTIPGDTFIGASLQTYGEWCEFEIDLLSTLPLKGKSIIDGGANIGTHAIPLSRMTDKKVFAFEPQPRLNRLLMQAVHANRAENIMVSECALGRSPHIMKAGKIPAGQKFNYGALPLADRRFGEFSVNVEKIDSLGLEDVGLIKLDLEGMEADALWGAIETIRRCKPFLYIEANGADCSAISAFFETVNYGAVWSIGPYFNPSNHLKSSADLWPLDTPPSCNLLAWHRGQLSPSEAINKMVHFAGGDDNWRHAVERMQLTAA